MSDDGETTINLKGLEKLAKALKGKQPIGRIGILAGNAVRSEGGINNAEIGAIHEFGTRSFLRIPLADHLEKALQESGAFDPEVIKEVIKTGSMVPWLKKVMVVAETVVQEGFESGGYGKWPPSNMDRKTNHQTLVETGQLMNSITSEVKE